MIDNRKYFTEFYINKYGKIRHYWLDAIEGLNSQELESLLASNRFPHHIRKSIRGSIGFLIIEELTPLIGLIGASAVILDLIRKHKVKEK